MRPTLLLMALLLAIGSISFAEDLTVLRETPEGIPPGKQLEVYLKQQFYQYVERRLEAYEAVKTRADCANWQKQRREFFLRQLNGFPQRTPLNAKNRRSARWQGLPR